MFIYCLFNLDVVSGHKYCLFYAFFKDIQYLYFIFQDTTANIQINNLQGLQKTKTLDTEIQNTKQPRRITQKKQCFCRGVLQTEWDTCK